MRLVIAPADVDEAFGNSAVDPHYKLMTHLEAGYRAPRARFGV